MKRRTFLLGIAAASVSSAVRASSSDSIDREGAGASVPIQSAATGDQTMFTFRTIPCAGSSDWTAQALFDNGTLYIIQTLGRFSNQAGQQGGNSTLQAQTLAHYACIGNVGTRGGNYQIDNHEPFE